MRLLNILRILIVAVLVIGLPIFIYLGFIADDPILDVEYDVGLGRQSVASFAEDTTMIMLAPEEYPEAYRHLERIVQEVVKSQEIEYGALDYNHAEDRARDQGLDTSPRSAAGQRQGAGTQRRK